MTRLRCGTWNVGVENGLAELSRPRCFLEDFEALVESSPPPEGSLELVRVAAGQLGDGARLLDGSNADSGTYLVEGNFIRADIPDEPFAAEAALKAAFAVATHRQGGLLVHSSAVSFDGRAVVSFGPSGAGKSTFARLCKNAGGILLSDETNALFPDRTVQGTPFQSDDDNGPSTARVALAGIFTLVQGGEESLAPVTAPVAVTRLLEQAYRPAPGEMGPTELLRRASERAMHPAIQSFTFRKDDAAGRFMREWARRS